MPYQHYHVSSSCVLWLDTKDLSIFNLYPFYMMLLRYIRNIRLIPRQQRWFSTESGGDELVYSREFADIKVDDFEELYSKDPRKKEKIETILSEYEFLKYNSMGRVPSELNKQDMTLLLEEGFSVHARDKLFNFLFKREMVKRQTKMRLQRIKEETKARRAVKLEEFEKRKGSRTGLLDDNGDIMYGLWHNSLFCRIPENKLKSGSSSSRLINAALFGRKLIFDFGFEEYMVNHTIRNSVDQVQEAYGLNRFTYQDPFDFWFCNFDRNSYTGQYCSEKAIKNLYSGSMITVKEDCFTNYFDKSRLVYLSPHAREPLGKIHKNDDIYIIGVYNDKGNQQPVSYRKALKLGIRTKCLPLDTHIPWQGPTKSLCINHVTGIMLEIMANRGDWYAALTKHIPKRKIKPMELVVEEEQRRQERFHAKKNTSKFSLRDDLDL